MSNLSLNATMHAKSILRCYISDIDSDDDSPTNDSSEMRALRDCSNLPHNMGTSTDTLCHLPIYRQEKYFLKPQAVTQTSQTKSKKVLKQTNLKNKPVPAVSSLRNCAGDITKENIYEIDAYSDNELGFVGDVTANLKAATKKNKKAVNKKRGKNTGKLAYEIEFFP